MPREAVEDDVDVVRVARVDRDATDIGCARRSERIDCRGPANECYSPHRARRHVARAHPVLPGPMDVRP